MNNIMATKKEEARKELIKLPQVATRLIDTGIGSQWDRDIECCQVNGEIYMKPTWRMFDSVKITKYIKSGDFSESEALPLRTGGGPFTWMLQVKAVKRLKDILISEIRHDTERNTFAQKIEALLSYRGGMENLSLTDEQIHEAHEHVSNRTRLLRESKQEQNEQIASEIGGADGEPLGNYQLSKGTLNKLERGGITTVEQLLACNRLDLLNIGGFGRKALTEIEDLMETCGWQYGESKPQKDAPLTVTLKHKPGDMIKWREWTKDGGFGKEHQTKIDTVTVNVYWDETRQQYDTTEKYSTSVMADGNRVSVTVDLMSDDIIIGCM